MKKTISAFLAAMLLFSVMSFGSFSVNALGTPVTGITMESSVKVKTGQSVQLNPVVTPENATDKSVKWETSSNIISVDSDGKVTANRFVPFSGSYSFLRIPSYGGTATVKATTIDGGYTVTCKVVVTPDIWNIVLLAVLIGIVVVPMFLTPVV